MQNFRFKLAAKLRLAEAALDEVQIRLAEEQTKLNVRLLQLQRQEVRLQEAINGQKGAVVQDKGLWHKYADQQHRELILCQAGYNEQNGIVDTVRENLLEKHKEVKKLQRLKEQQFLALALIARRLEQYAYDETAQNVFLLRARSTAVGKGA